MRDLENRLAEKKYAVYQPMIDLLSKMLDLDAARAADPDELKSAFGKFDAWIVIYGSDAAVRAWHHFRQGSFNDAPSILLIRFYADFVMAARRDMGHLDTTVSAMELVGTRINDIYGENNEMATVLTLDWVDLAKHVDWTPPWMADRSKTEVESARSPA
ncbi:hypothetical protein OHA70_13225 [Kribbella sp. NBC_00382]|uniref:hypothetical protein n=1 Tax=Kribbella sp. NBC_00382 TaxID=2975967 RepID=UPI002E1CAE2A